MRTLCAQVVCYDLKVEHGKGHAHLIFVTIHLPVGWGGFELFFVMFEGTSFKRIILVCYCVVAPSLFEI